MLTHSSQICINYAQNSLHSIHIKAHALLFTDHIILITVILGNTQRDCLNEV